MQFGRKLALELTLEKTFAAVRGAQHQRSIADQHPVQSIGKGKREDIEMGARIEPFPGLASVAGAHQKTVLATEIAIVRIEHLDAKDSEVDSEVDLYKVQSAVFGEQQFAAIPRNESAGGAGRPDVEELVVECD